MAERQQEPIFGYLHVASFADETSDGPDLGPWVGGYLITTSTGRPLEFHCTAPVVASRAQLILYGKSLRPFVFGEHLGATLVGKAKLQPSVLMVADADAAAAGRAKSLPTVLLPTSETIEAPPNAPRIENLPASAWVLSDDTSAEQRTKVTAWLDALAGSVELVEPFERIREAIREAQGGVDAPRGEEQGGSPCRVAA